MPISALIGALLAGLLGGAHCLAMCGGFVTALSGKQIPASPQGAPLRPAGVLARRALPYNLGRMTTYVGLGAIAGSAGGAALVSSDLLAVQRALYVVANAFLLLLAWAIASDGKGLASLQRVGAALFAHVLPAVRPLRARDDAPARFALGTLWGLVPCGLVYSVLPIALFAGGAVEGGAVMLAFGLGTLPNLLAAGWVATRARARLDSPFVRDAAAVLLIGFAGVGIWRAFSGPLASVHGAFCF
jgi:sulfite exporter TauE/SafE